MFLKLMYITNDPEVAMIADRYGVDRVWIDLETLGKEKRQRGYDSVKSNHSVSDIRKIKPLLKNAEMLVRINPWNKKSKKEINDVISAGADIIMLPYWRTASEVRNFLDAVAGRCRTTLLLETKEAVECLDEVLVMPEIDEIHIGLNDLHMSYKLDFMFELLANGTVEKICRKLKIRGIPYGFGGIARIGYGDLPAERVIEEHYRLGSTRAILSRSFCNYQKMQDYKEIEETFASEMKKLRSFETYVSTLSPENLEKDRAETAEIVEQISSRVRARKQAS